MRKRRKCIENNCILFELKYDYSEQDFYDLCKAINDRTGLINTLQKGGKINGIK